MNYHVEKIDSEIRGIINRCYPGYHGKKVKISTDIPGELNSYWDGGSKDYYVFYLLSTKAILPLDSNHPIFESQNPRKLDYLPHGLLIVEHSIFCGKDMGTTIYVNSEDVTPFLPLYDMEITEDQKIVLAATKALKNSYGGETDIRFKHAKSETGITRDRWNIAVKSLITSKYLRKNGSITPKGRNIDTSKYRIW